MSTAELFNDARRCRRRRHGKAVALRRTNTSISTWGRVTEPVCGHCANELDELAEHLNRAAISVDRAGPHATPRRVTDLRGLLRAAA